MGRTLPGEEEEKKTSPQFQEFMEFLGDKVELLNWPHYKGKKTDIYILLFLLL